MAKKKKENKTEETIITNSETIESTKDVEIAEPVVEVKTAPKFRGVRGGIR